MENQPNLMEDSCSFAVNDKFYLSESQNQFMQLPFSFVNQYEGTINHMLSLAEDYQKSTKLQQNSSEKQPQGGTNLGNLQNEMKNDSQSIKQKRIRKQTKEKNSTILEKKKQNSKNYRQRKKQYMNKLIEENDYFKKRNAELQDKVQLLEDQLREIKCDSVNNYKSGFQKEYRKDVQILKAKIFDGKTSNSQLVKIALKMRQKYGPAGRDRKIVQNYYMSQFINATMVDFQKYVFNSLLKKTGLFGELKSSVDKKASELLNLSEGQKNYFKTTAFQELHPAAISLDNSCKNLYKCYISLLDEAKKFHDKLMTGLNYTIVPQLTRLIFWFDDNKHLPQMKKLKEDWIKVFSGQTTSQSEPN